MVNSDPLQADVYAKLANGEKKPLGKTPLSMPMVALKQTLGESGGNGQYFSIVVEKQGYISQSNAIRDFGDHARHEAKAR